MAKLKLQTVKEKINSKFESGEMILILSSMVVQSICSTVASKSLSIKEEKKRKKTWQMKRKRSLNLSSTVHCRWEQERHKKKGKQFRECQCNDSARIIKSLIAGIELNEEEKKESNSDPSFNSNILPLVIVDPFAEQVCVP